MSKDRRFLYKKVAHISMITDYNIKAKWLSDPPFEPLQTEIPLYFIVMRQLKILYLLWWKPQVAFCICLLRSLQCFYQASFSVRFMPVLSTCSHVSVSMSVCTCCFHQCHTQRLNCKASLNVVLLCGTDLPADVKTWFPAQLLHSPENLPQCPFPRKGRALFYSLRKILST